MQRRYVSGAGLFVSYYRYLDACPLFPSSMSPHSARICKGKPRFSRLPELVLRMAGVGEAVLYLALMVTVGLICMSSPNASFRIVCIGFRSRLQLQSAFRPQSHKLRALKINRFEHLKHSSTMTGIVHHFKWLKSYRNCVKLGFSTLIMITICLTKSVVESAC